ncbi:hypothetical protein Zmor_014280 [Zophobas morio]|uniref:Uncharacterized protein n=1 Tax=Zophobas morio TaxID=2755281 RepID=A0AA38IEH6_9CUCU|nr:hypothetical protein Zmor_014280 [Zophobas morio]
MTTVTYGTGHIKTTQGIIKICESVICFIGLILIAIDGWSSDLTNAYVVGTASFPPIKVSLWSKYSMLRSSINLHEGVDISKFPCVIAFLKRKGEGYRPKKFLTLRKSQVEEFLIKADSACRCQELVTLLTTCVKDCKTDILVNFQDSKTKIDRHVVIVSGNMENINLVELVRAYMALRPIKTPHQRFFINYDKEKCTVQAVGIHKIGNVPAMVAKYLSLENASS